jgi:hypothetical protein
VRLVLVEVLLFAAAVASVPPAYASCAIKADVSPYAFVGTVISTERKDHVATVITDSGQRVTVLGTEGGFPESFSSTDRRYALGGRYEFHPINAESPYRDNICTATRQPAGPGPQPLEPAKEFLPSWLPVDEQAGLVGYLLFFGPLAAGVVLLIVLGRKVLQRFSTRAPAPGPSQQ